MNNEPVAWIDPKELDMAVSTSVTKHKQFDTDIPLYADTSKEMIEMIDALKKENELLRKRFGEELDAHHSALRKIGKLRKAQEK
jgi:hypothetical protein